MSTNAVIDLSEQETMELRKFWQNFKSTLNQDDWLFINVKLNRLKAKLTKNQLYRAVMNIAHSGYEEPIPEWILEMLDPDME